MILESVHEPAFSLVDVLFLASFAGNAINDVRALTGHIVFLCVLPLCDTRCDLSAHVDACAISAMNCCAYIVCAAPYGCIMFLMILPMVVRACSDEEASQVGGFS